MLECHQECRGELQMTSNHQIGLFSTNYIKRQNKVGTLPKNTASGPFADEWKRAFGEISKEVEEVDITPALSTAFAIKDSDELVG